MLFDESRIALTHGAGCRNQDQHAFFIIAPDPHVKAKESDHLCCVGWHRKRTVLRLHSVLAAFGPWWVRFDVSGPQITGKCVSFIYWYFSVFIFQRLKPHIFENFDPEGKCLLGKVKLLFLIPNNSASHRLAIIAAKYGCIPVQHEADDAMLKVNHIPWKPLVLMIFQFIHEHRFRFLARLFRIRSVLLLDLTKMQKQFLVNSNILKYYWYPILWYSYSYI